MLLDVVLLFMRTVVRMQCLTPTLPFAIIILIQSTSLK